jgi:hypothetical protein
VFDSDLAHLSGGGGLDEALLRRYEQNKLKYYFAIVTMESPDAADYVYKSLDQVEVEGKEYHHQLLALH